MQYILNTGIKGDGLLHSFRFVLRSRDHFRQFSVVAGGSQYLVPSIREKSLQ